MKSVLISVQPKWCELIASGKKTVEIRKTRPKLDTPFKCYIYCTKEKPGRKHQYEAFGINGKPVQCGGYVIAEFVCDEIQSFGVPYPAFSARMNKEIMARSCLTYDELHRYARENCLYAWHISNLVIYDKSKELKKFRNPCTEYAKDNPQCGRCDYYHSMGEYPAECGCDGAKPMIRPPQSWCYVEEV